MQVHVTGRHLELPPRVKEEALEKFSRVSRLWDHLIDMEIVFDEDKNPRIPEPIHCEVTAHAKGKSLHATATAQDHSTAIDRAQKKLERQVRKLKTRVVARRQRPSIAVPRPAGVVAEE